MFKHYSHTLAIAAVATALLTPAIASAHTSIWPRQSTVGATERYTVRVPTEGKVATVGAELDVPAGVRIETLSVPAGWKHEIKRQGDRIVGIVWTMDIPSGQFAEFGFVALNPREGTELVWTLRQRFADGTVEDFTKGPNGIRPTAVTKLNPRP